MRTYHISATFYAGLLVVLISGVTCIRRNNPYDPINYVNFSTLCPPESLWTLQKDIFTIMIRDSVNGFIAGIQEYTDSLRADSQRIGNALNQNVPISNANRDTMLYNAVVDSFNRLQTIADSLRFKHRLTVLKAVPPLYSLTQPLAGKTAGVATAVLRIKKRFSEYEASCPANKDSIKLYKDTILAVISPITLFCQKHDTVRSKYLAASAAIADSNARIVLENSAIDRYNEDILWEKLAKKHIVLDSSGLMLNDLQTADFLKPGDTVLVKGTIDIAELKIQSSGTSDKPIVVMGTKQMTSIINAKSGITFSNRHYIHLVYLTIRGSNGAGFKIEDNSSGIELIHCIIRDNAGYGMEVIQSSLSIENSKILCNGNSGIRFSPQSTESALMLSNVLIAKNVGYGLEAGSFIGSLNQVTISNNALSGIRIENPPEGINNSIYFSLVSYNRSYGLQTTFQELSKYQLKIVSCNFYQNIPADISAWNNLDITTYNPNFADTAKNDFTIGPGDLQGKGIGYVERP